MATPTKPVVPITGERAAEASQRLRIVLWFGIGKRRRSLGAALGVTHTETNGGAPTTVLECC
jgi:hypothetical protein